MPWLWASQTNPWICANSVFLPVIRSPIYLYKGGKTAWKQQLKCEKDVQGLGCYLLAQTFYTATSWVLGLFVDLFDWSVSGKVRNRAFSIVPITNNSRIAPTKKRQYFLVCFIDDIRSEPFGGWCTAVTFSKCSFSITTLRRHNTIQFL